jgi:hypothetical protein
MMKYTTHFEVEASVGLCNDAFQNGSAWRRSNSPGSRCIYPRSEIGTLEDPPDGLMISRLYLGVLSRDPLNEIECDFSGDGLNSAFSFNFFNGQI